MRKLEAEATGKLARIKLLEADVATLTDQLRQAESAASEARAMHQQELLQMQASINAKVSLLQLSLLLVACCA